MDDVLRRKLLIHTVGFRRNTDPVTSSIEYQLPVFPRHDYCFQSRTSRVRNYNETRSPLVRLRLRQSVARVSKRK